MPNAIKYNVSAETLALKKGNFWIGTGDVGKGPTSSTGYYNGITPPTGGYTIYLNKESNGPSIYTVTTEAQLTGLTSTIAGQTLTTSGACLNYFATQTDKMIFNIDYSAVVTDGLILHIDAAFTPSYPQSGVTVYNLVPSQYNGTLTNGPTWSSGSFIFDGTDDIIQWAIQPVTGVTNDITYNMWFNMNSTSGDQAFFSFRDSMITLNNGTQWKYWWNVNAVNGQITTSAIQTGTWYNMTLTQSGSSTTLYINGIAQPSIVSGNITATRDAKAIGQYDLSPSAYGKYNGKISLAQIYNKCLTSSEITQNYAAIGSRYFPLQVQYLVVAGGGGGNNNRSGGGGAGGLLSGTTTSLSLNTNYTVTVGSGGAYNAQGSNSVFNTLTSIGGGQSGALHSNGFSGGSGGGSGHMWFPDTPRIGGSGVSGQGFSGGSAYTGTPNNYQYGPGGGGAGQVGADTYTNVNVGGAGGNGLYSSEYVSLGGSPAGWFAGGGGGGISYNGSLIALGGNGGGGRNTVNGVVNTGGGGGGNGVGSGGSASGGSGIVIIRVPVYYSATFSSGVTYSLTKSNGYSYYVVTATSTTSETVRFS